MIDRCPWCHETDRPSRHNCGEPWHRIENAVPTPTHRDAPSGELLPCPFCGVKGVVVQMEGAWIAGCDAGQDNADEDATCRANAIGFYHLTREGAVAAWNRRAPSASHQRREVTAQDVDEAVTVWDDRPEDGWPDARDYSLRGLLRRVLEQFAAKGSTPARDGWHCVECGALVELEGNEHCAKHATAPASLSVSGETTPLGDVEGALLEYGRQCIIFGVKDEAALTLAARDTDADRYKDYRPSGDAKDKARLAVLDAIRRLRAGAPSEEVTDDAPCPHCPHQVSRRRWVAHYERAHADLPSVPFDVMATWYYSTDDLQVTKSEIVRLYLTGKSTPSTGYRAPIGGEG